MSKSPMPGYNDDKNIHDGSDPKKVLRERGVAYDGTGFVPEVPDYLGYVLGLMLLWLIFTGYTSVVGMIQNPESPIAKIGEKTVAMKEKAVEAGIEAKRTVEETVLQNAPDTTSRGRLADAPIHDPEQGWAARQLDALNNGIQYLAASASNLLDGLFSGGDPGESSGREGDDSGRTPEDRGDTLDYF